MELSRVEVDLAHEVGVERSLAPPVAASPSVNGRVERSRNGRAPSSRRRLTKMITFWRYWVFVGDHGVARFEPHISLSAIHGVAQADEATAR